MQKQNSAQLTFNFASASVPATNTSLKKTYKQSKKRLKTTLKSITKRFRKNRSFFKLDKVVVSKINEVPNADNISNIYDANFTGLKNKYGLLILIAENTIYNSQDLSRGQRHYSTFVCVPIKKSIVAGQFNAKVNTKGEPTTCLILRTTDKPARQFLIIASDYTYEIKGKASLKSIPLNFKVQSIKSIRNIFFTFVRMGVLSGLAANEYLEKARSQKINIKKLSVKKMP